MYVVEVWLATFCHGFLLRLVFLRRHRIAPMTFVLKTLHTGANALSNFGIETSNKGVAGSYQGSM